MLIELSIAKHSSPLTCPVMIRIPILLWSQGIHLNCLDITHLVSELLVLLLWGLSVRQASVLSNIANAG